MQKAYFVNSHKYIKSRQLYLCPTEFHNHKGAEQTLITEIQFAFIQDT